MKKASNTIRFAGSSWENILLNEHNMTVHINEMGHVSSINALFETQTGWSADSWKNLDIWQNHIQFLEQGTPVSIRSKIENGTPWRGLISVEDVNNRRFLTHGSVIPCLNSNGRLLFFSIVMNTVDVSYLDEELLETNDVRSNATKHFWMPDTGAPVPLGNSPVDIKTSDIINSIKDLLKGKERRFLTLHFQTSTNFPVNFRINKAVITELLPALIQASLHTTHYGLIHLHLSLVELEGNQFAVRVRAEDTGDPYEPQGKPVRGMLRKNNSLLIEKTIAAFRNHHANLALRSDDSGNMYEFLAVIDGIGPSAKNGPHISYLESWPDKSMKRHMDLDDFNQRARASLVDALNDNVLQVQDFKRWAAWIHTNRPAIHYLGNSDLAKRFSDLEKLLKHHPEPVLVQQFEALCTELKQWLFSNNLKPKQLNHENNTYR